MSNEKREFEAQAEAKEVGIVVEVIDLLRHNKKWWLTPILLVLLLVGGLALMSGSPAAPFIYTLF